MNSTDTLMILVIVMLIVFAGFLAMAETAVTRISRHKATVLLEEGRRGARQLRHITDHPERYINPVLLLVLMSHLIAATLVGFLASRLVGPVGGALIAIGEIIVIFVFAEAAPKTWAVQHADRAALLAAPFVKVIADFPPVRMLSLGLIGLSNVVLPGKGLKQGPYVSEEELLAMADAAADDESIEQEERELIRSVFEFGDTVAREVMVPRPDIRAVDASQRVEEVIDVALREGYSRIPVYEERVDSLLGVVFTKDLLRAEREGRADMEVRILVRDGMFVPESKPVAELMREMQKRKLHMAFVLDEYGGTAGLVTLEDLIEELVGEITDEYDVEEAPVEHLDDGSVRVNGRMPVDEVNELLHCELPEGDDWETVAGLVFNRLGHVPLDGESVEVDGHRLVAERVQGRRIGRVRIESLKTPVLGDDDAPNEDDG